jgi:hypothetical protein
VRSDEKQAHKMLKPQYNPVDSGPPLAYRIDEFVRLSGMGRTSVYMAMRSGALRAVKVGCRTLIPAESASEFLRSLPTYRPQASSSKEVA